MKRRKCIKICSAVMAAVLIVTACDAAGFAAGGSNYVKAAAVSGTQNANLDFEDGLTGWEKTGTAEVKTDGAQHGSSYLHLAADSSVTMTITDVKQGSYTLSAWVKGSAGKNANITVSGTGGPDAQALIDVWKKGNAWNQTGHRNVLVYNGQMTITISSGSAALDLDHLELTLDSDDANAIRNWDFEQGLASWEKTGTATEDAGNADTGAKAVRLAAGSEIAQTVQVEPNTKYALTMRAKVDKQDVFETKKVTSDYRKDAEGKPAVMGELQERASLGDRVNLGVRVADGTVFRQTPSGTEEYSLVSLTFTTGPKDTSVEIYANTKYDDHYKDSVTIYNTEGTELADNWQGNGADYAYVDNFDLFQIQDANYRKGADVSFLPAIEDLGGKYFANGVQQDCLRILSNHGVNSITNMIFVKAGEPAHYPDSLKTVYIDEYWSSGYWYKKDGSQAELKMIQGGYFDKAHSLELGKRATALGMSYLPSFHYSDTWMSAAKAFCPVEWLDTDYGSETGYRNTDIAHMQSIVYNYVYDFVKALAEHKVNVCGVKHGNEQDGGIVRPVGNGGTSEGHAKLIAASYQAVEDAMPGVSGYVHTNSGYDTGKFANLFQPLLQKGAKMDGTAFSLYGGRNSGNIVKIANFMAKDPALRYLDYINVETGFSFTRYAPTVDTAKSSMYQGSYYYGTPNGQYNWLLDYQQSALDAPNPYGQTRGFYYWETDWIPTPGAGSTDGGSADVSQRIMFNNGDTAIREMGSLKPGKAGDMMDSMYAYLIRGCAKNKADSLHTESSGEGDYSVTVAEPAGITLSQEELTLKEGTKVRLQPTVTPIDKVLTDSHITYVSANPEIVRVTPDGFVCGVKAGTTTVTASVKGGKTAEASVTVQAAAKASGITLKADGETIADKGTKAARLFDRIQLTSVLAGAPTDQTVIYRSSNPKVASFLGETWQTPDGEMRQETEKTDTLVQLNVVGAGTATITATAASGGASVSFTLNASKTDAESVTVAPAETDISFGRTKQLKATVEPADTTRYKVRWESADETIAAVDENGLVTAVGLGDVQIRAVSDDSDAVFGVCRVHVTEIKAEGVTLDRENLTLQTGSAKMLHAIVAPSDAYNKKVAWKSEDPGIASVDANGTVTGNAVGTTTITARTEDGGFTAGCRVTVQVDAIPVTGIVLEEKEYYFTSDYFSETNPEKDAPVCRLTAKVEPETATDADITWSSDAPEVAAVDALGRVTAVSEGVAVITAATKDGAFSAQANVYVPSVSESFDNREEASAWGMEIAHGFSNKAAKFSDSVEASGEGKILQLTAAGNGGRGIQKRFAKSVKNDRIVVDFDWNVGKPANSNGCYIAITDSDNNRYLSIQTNAGAELVYSSGGQPADGIVLADASPVGTGFTAENAWYRIHAVINTKKKTTEFTVTSLADPKLTASREIAFDAGTSFTGDVAALQMVATRKGSLSWQPALDNVNIYKTALAVREIRVDQEKVRLIPISGTLGAKCQLTASVIPSNAAQGLKWESSDTALVNVDQNGLVTPAATYDSLDKIVPGTCTIKVSSVEDPSVYREIPAEVSNTPNASEFFSVYDEAGREVYPGGEVIRLKPGDSVKYTPVLTGGDGASDIAGLKWESDNSSVVKVDPQTGIVTAVGSGTARVRLTATMYAGNPQVAELDFAVADGQQADLKDAVIRLEKTSYTYDGKKKTPAVTVTLNGGKVPAEHYDAAYTDNTNAGTATVTVTGKGGYTGTASAHFTIRKAAAKITLKKSSLKKALGDKNFGFGASASSKGKLTYVSSNKKVVKVSKGKGKITGIGETAITVKAAATRNYNAASKKLKITVTPKKAALAAVSSKKPGQAVIMWKKDAKAGGYLIQYSKNKNFKKAQSKTIKSNKTTSCTIQKLQKGKRYYFRICAYKTVNKKRICGAYSKTRNVKIKK